MISFIGYQAQEVPAAANLNIILKDDTQLLQDVVVIGYGTMKKKDLTGAVGSLGAKDMNNSPMANVGQALQGKVAGLQVVDNGKPGDNVSMKIRGIVVGTDFHFGHNRRGDYHLLEIYAKKLHYELKVIDKVQYENRDISSTFIREEVEKGNMEKVKYLLGYDYFVEGVVIHGREMGAKVLGIPTINIIPPENKLLPPFGVYVCDVVVGDKTYHGIADVGCKPTIEGVNPVAVETNIFDFNENLYGKKVRVCFRSRERSEMKFESLEALKQQLEQDIAYGRFYVQQH